VRGLRGSATLTPLRAALATAGVVLLVDQLTKWWASAVLPGDPVVVVDGFLQFRYVTNPGAAFSMLPGAGGIIALVAIAVAVFIVVVARRVETRLEAISLGLVLGGAIGNLLDRVFRGSGLLDGEVVDFIDFSFFPAFNVADSAITIGAIMAVVVAFLLE
jgi:signal peptidase II